VDSEFKIFMCLGYNTNIMSWAFSFDLLPGEDIVEDSSKNLSMLIKPVYSVLLTNQRVLFRFDGLGSLLKKTFLYNQIQEARPLKRFNINYLFIKANGSEHFFNIADPELWSIKITNARDQYSAS
jgi:hypothetical protein